MNQNSVRRSNVYCKALDLFIQKGYSGTSISMIANRGLLTPWLVSREVGFSFWRFFRAIYGWPFAASVPVVALAFSLRESVLPGRNWAQIAMIMVLVAASYYALALFLCLPRAHRELLQGWVGRTLRFDH